MDTFKSLLAKVNEKIGDSPLFYITNDPERALGLEKHISNYHIICIDDNDIVDYMHRDGVKVFCLEKELNKQNAIFRNSNRLLKHKLTQEYIKAYTANSGYTMFFKIAPNIERSLDEFQLKALNTTSSLNRKFELKLSQYKYLSQLNIRLPETKIVKLIDAKYSALVTELGENFILQFNRGHTGGGTIEIDSEMRLRELQKKFPERKVRISRKIEGDPYTLNACVTKHGICWGGLSYQITGIPECTSKKAGTVGNDWEYTKNLNPSVLKDISRFTKVIGEEMAESGFLGLFGLDFVLEKNTQKIYVIEINARQPASIPMHTKLQMDQNQIPLKLLAIAEFLGVEYELDVDEYNNQASKPISASQIFFRNKYTNKAEVIGSVKVGTYRILGDNSAFDWSNGHPEQKKNVIFITEDRDMPLVFQDEAYSIDSIEKAGLLILASREGKIISSNAEAARIQFKNSMLDKNAKIRTVYMQMLQGLNTNIILKELPK